MDDYTGMLLYTHKMRILLNDFWWGEPTQEVPPGQ